MRKTFMLLLLCSTCIAGSAPVMPLHPYRKVGEKYYNLNPLYERIKMLDRLRNQPGMHVTTESIPPRPMPEWIGVDEPMWGRVSLGFRVVSAMEDGLLVHVEWFNEFGSGGSGEGATFFLRNYPGFKNFTDKQQILFLAMRSGNYKYTTAMGAAVTVEAYDYGIPYDPWKLKAEKEKAATNTQKPEVKP